MNASHLADALTGEAARWKGEYEGKTVCVAGGTSGIGAAIAEALAICGAKVFVTGSAASSTKMPATPSLRVDALDVRDRDSVWKYAARFDQLHLLVNCVGASHAHRELEPDYLTDTLAINLTGVAYLCDALHPALCRDGRGAIVNFASVTSFLGSASNPIYSAAKGGIVQLTKSLAALWARDGIRVNAIAPGYIRTRLTQRRWSDEVDSTRIVGRTPLGRWGEPADLVGPTLFLGSSSASFITGAILAVDGGFLVS